MIDLDRLAGGRLERHPFRWAAVDELFRPRDAAALADTFPCDHFKRVAGYGGEKDYEYDARALIGMGADVVSHREHLSAAWRALADDFLMPQYRAALSTLTGCDLRTAALEVNVFHYGPGAQLGPHPDLPDKVVTHVLYFNRAWSRAEGGCLTVLGSRDAADVHAEVPPLVGHSAVLVRSDDSWHAVRRVVDGCRSSRRSLTATFYRPGSVSTMWPPDDATLLHWVAAPDLALPESL